MKKLFIGLLAVLLLMVVGCQSTSKITELDPETGKVIKITETSESVVKQVVDSTKDKTCYLWEKGWFAKLNVATVTTDNPTGGFDAECGNIDTGFLSIHKDHKNITGLDDVIRACNATALSISANGISGNSGTGSSTATDEGSASSTEAAKQTTKD